ncbi:hypothetical protein ASZ90_015712 [hydrocarbon metagenome]|uniref:Uncharacterized protein n=1 Tax=hydrocarbon metagenome TaxID=938273 RepID=A0A0W8F178_9ZZZZ
MEQESRSGLELAVGAALLIPGTAMPYPRISRCIAGAYLITIGMCPPLKRDHSCKVR